MLRIEASKGSEVLGSDGPFCRPPCDYAAAVSELHQLLIVVRWCGSTVSSVVLVLFLRARSAHTSPSWVFCRRCYARVFQSFFPFVRSNLQTTVSCCHWRDRRTPHWFFRRLCLGWHRPLHQLRLFHFPSQVTVADRQMWIAP